MNATHIDTICKAIQGRDRWTVWARDKYVFVYWSTGHGYSRTWILDPEHPDTLSLTVPAAILLDDEFKGSGYTRSIKWGAEDEWYIRVSLPAGEIHWEATGPDPLTTACLVIEKGRESRGKDQEAPL